MWRAQPPQKLEDGSSDLLFFTPDVRNVSQSQFETQTPEELKQNRFLIILKKIWGFFLVWTII